MSEPRIFEATCPECGVALQVPEQDLIGLWEGENAGDGKRDRDYELTCHLCNHRFFVADLEVAILTPAGEV